MNATLWARVQEMVDEAAALPAGERTSFVAARTSGDEPLRAQVMGMLQILDATDGFLADAVGGAADSLSRAGELEPGDRIGVYRVEALLGHGGMGSVYRAQRSDDQFRQDVAIKLVRMGPGANEELFLRFRAERQILANISHPHIARLLDGGVTESGSPYLVMEFVNGQPLDAYLRETAPVLRARLELFRKLCSAVQYAHSNLVVHRDLKPGNVLVTPESEPKLLDFGIAKLLDTGVTDQTIVMTQAAERLMTPEYASPEQVRGDAITTATDVYSLGVLLYEMLTGTRPFRLKQLSPAEMERVICETQPRPPSSVGLTQAGAVTDAKPKTTRATAIVRVHRLTDLDRIVLKAMHKTPARRYATAGDLSADVERYLQGFPVAARPDSVAYRSRLFLARHKLAVAAAVLFLVTIVALSINLAVQARRARKEAASADAVSNYLTGLFQFVRPDATQGRSVSAREILDSGTDQLNTQWKGEPAIKARLLSTLGVVYYQLGDLNRSEALLEEAQRIHQQLGDTTSNEAVQTGAQLGDLLNDKGKYAASERQFNAYLATQTKLHGADSVEAADALDGLARLYWVMGDLQRAEGLEHRVVAISTRKLGPDDDTSEIYQNNLETMLADEAKYKEAEKIARRLLEERRRKLGLYNTGTVTSMNNYAFILSMTGRLREAEALREETLAVRRKLYGKEHPDLSMSMVSTGWVKMKLGKLDEAEQLTRDGMEMALKLEGPESLDTALDEDYLGQVMLAKGKLAEARQWVQKGLDVRLSKTPPPPQRLAESYDHLGMIDLADRNFASARANLEHGYALRKSFYGPGSDLTADSLNDLGLLELAQGNAGAAEHDFKEALGIAERLFPGQPHPLRVAAEDGLGRALQMQGSAEEGRSDRAMAAQMRAQLGMEPILEARQESNAR